MGNAYKHTHCISDINWNVVIMSEQSDLFDNPENPAVIPVRKLTQSELLVLRYQARQFKFGLSALRGMLESFGLSEEFEMSELRLDDMGYLCDEVVAYCGVNLKAYDAPKKARVKK